MTKEEFISLGLTEEQAEKAAAASAKELEGYVAKGEYDAKVKELETAKGSITDLTGKLKDFDGVDVEGLKTSVKDWEKKYNTDLADVKKTAAVDMAIMQAKGRNPKAIKALLDMDKIKLKEDGTLEGFDIEGLKKSDGYLFDIETHSIEGTGHAGSSQGGSAGGKLEGFISAARNAAGLK